MWKLSQFSSGKFSFIHLCWDSYYSKFTELFVVHGSVVNIKTLNPALPVGTLFFMDCAACCVQASVYMSLEVICWLCNALNIKLEVTTTRRVLPQAHFLAGEFFAQTRSENRNWAMWLVRDKFRGEKTTNWCECNCSRLCYIASNLYYRYCLLLVRDWLLL